MKKIIALSIVFVILLVAFFYIYHVSSSQHILPDNYVTNIVDGDTFDIFSGERIRMICIDSPEKGEKGYEEAAQYLEYLILHKEVTLEKDVSENDSYRRLLRYVYVDGIFVNKEMVKSGNAVLFPYGNDTKRCREIN